MKKNHFILLMLLLPVLVPLLLSPITWTEITRTEPNFEESFLYGWATVIGTFLGFGITIVGIPYLLMAWIIYKKSKVLTLKTLQKYSWLIPPVFAISVGISYTIIRFFIYHEETETLWEFFEFLTLYTMGAGYIYVLIFNIIYMSMVKLNKLSSTA
ncbi:MAG: hypothetical protein U1E36_06930 [Rickettsiales bacterium]